MDLRVFLSGPFSGATLTALASFAAVSGYRLPLNAGDGSVSPIPEYITGENMVTATRSLGKGDTVIVGLITDPARFGQRAKPVHTEASTADAVIAGANGEILVICALALPTPRL